MRNLVQNKKKKLVSLASSFSLDLVMVPQLLSRTHNKFEQHDQLVRRKQAKIHWTEGVLLLTPQTFFCGRTRCPPHHSCPKGGWCGSTSRPLPRKRKPSSPPVVAVAWFSVRRATLQALPWETIPWTLEPRTHGRRIQGGQRREQRGAPWRGRSDSTPIDTQWK